MATVHNKHVKGIHTTLRNLTNSFPILGIMGGDLTYWNKLTARGMYHVEHM